MNGNRHNPNGSLVGGIILIAMGTMFLLDRLNLFNLDFGDWWPMFLIIPGVVMALDTSRKNKSGAFFMIAFGLMFQVRELHLFRWWHWDNMWPLMLIAIGAWMLFQHMTGCNQAPQTPPEPPGTPQIQA